MALGRVRRRGGGSGISASGGVACASVARRMGVAGRRGVAGVGVPAEMRGPMRGRLVTMLAGREKLEPENVTNHHSVNTSVEVQSVRQRMDTTLLHKAMQTDNSNVTAEKSTNVESLSHTFQRAISG